MIWVRGIAQAHPDEFAATMRSEFGVRLPDLGDTLSWGELAAFTRVAIADPSTRLGAAHQGWAYPASMADVVQIAAAAGKEADNVLPWGMADNIRRAESRKVTDADVQAARERLARVSAMKGLDGYDGG